MTAEEIQDRVKQVREVGYTILSGCFPIDIVETMARAFAPIWDGHQDIIRTSPNRGPMRHYIPLPFEVPFYQSAIHANPDIIAIVKAILGEDMEIVQYATDTPAKGSDYQEWHGDVGVLFPEKPDYIPPPAILCVNFSFVDIDRENGPLEVADGTQGLPFDIARERVEKGEIPHRPLFLKVGDALLRDPRCVHRGTPNTTNTPRPVAVFDYVRRWYRRRDRGRVSRQLYEKLTEVEQNLLKRIVEPEG